MQQRPILDGSRQQALRSVTTLLLVPLLLLLGSCSSIDPAVLSKLKKLPQLPTLESLLNKPPVTTSFTDAHAEVAFLDGTIPENARAFPMISMPRDPQGRYLLGPGLHELEAQSYCIQAGTHAPSQGDGYLSFWPSGNRALAGTAEAMTPSA